jgi:hypothetical protein
MVAIEVAAANATLDPREGSARINERVADSQTARIGERKRSSTLWKNGCYRRVSGRCRSLSHQAELTIPPSRAKANIILLLLVILKSPQCQTQTGALLSACHFRFRGQYCD